MSTKIEDKIASFFVQFPEQKFKKNSYLMKPHESINTIYYLESGFVKQNTYTVDGEEIVFNFFTPKSFFPTSLFLANLKNLYYLQAAQECVVYSAPAAQVKTFIETNPDVLLDLTQRLSRGMNGLLKRIESESYHHADNKIQSLLLYLADKFGQNTSQGIEISVPLTHTDLAAWVGLQRETVSRQLEKLKKEGIIQYQSTSIIIADKQKLEDLVAL